MATRLRDRWITGFFLTSFLGCAEAPPPTRAPSPCDLVAAPAPGPLAAERAGVTDPVALARIFLREARVQGDAGFYLLAEAAATCALSRAPEDPDAQHAHASALYNMHRFAEAEAIAAPLTTRRGAAQDWMLLGDAHMEQGHLDAAADAYQRAVDLAPEPAMIGRIVFLRWLWGDQVGALELAEQAARTASGDPETDAWSLATLGWLHALAGQPAPELDAAIALAPSLHQPRLWRARVRLLAGDTAGAAADLDATYADFEAWRIRKELDPNVDLGAHCVLDGRGCAQALAEADPPRASGLIEEEWRARQDALTRAVRAWVGGKAGQDTAAELRAAVATGTLDPEVAWLAGMQLGDRALLTRALATGPGLLPSQRAMAEARLGELP